MLGLLIVFAASDIVFALNHFKYTDCNTSPNKVIHFSNAHLSSDPVHIPGPLTGTIDVEVLRLISGTHFKLDVRVQKHGFFGYSNVACDSNVGSCSYELCDLLSGASYNNTLHCPRPIVESTPEFPCVCPIQPGNYHLKPSTFHIPQLSGHWAFLGQGDFKIHAQLTDTATNEQVGCYDVEISTEADCSGFGCLVG